ncbi:MAG: hypothetical protein AB1898_01405 [Acidobacteriota bacterium]
MLRIRLLLLLALCLNSGFSFSQTRKADYLRYIELAAEQGLEDYPSVIDKWKRTIHPSPLWGYDAPAQPIYLADMLGFLYQLTGNRSHAEKARDILVDFGRLREAYPPDFSKTRAEYADGVPALSNFFFLPAYSRAYLRIRGSSVLDRVARQTIERDLAHSLDFVFSFPEWGAMNRAMLRAEGLYYGALALTDHPHAKKWKQLAETLARDSLDQWEIEDASGYQATWLLSVFSYAEASGQRQYFESPLTRYYLDYFVQLLTPHGNIADFGDANWNGGWDRFVPVFEKAAAIYRNPHYKYVARELLVRAHERLETEWRRLGKPTEKAGKKLFLGGTGVGSALTQAYLWADDAIPCEKPTGLSREVLEDVIGKKIVFRNGWDSDSTFLLLNYRDEGDGALLQRDYLRQTLSVEEEKMHHGHSDENSICLLMSGGSVLLHDGGYRSDLPSGRWGAFRADYFHNRVVARKNKRDKDQEVFEFLRNSGAYRPVRTHKIDFLTFSDVDTSRTRLVDAELGYQWDRIITYLKSQDCFIVIDGLKILKADYYTFANLWHTGKILRKGDRYFDTAIDIIGNESLPGTRRLLIYFPESEAKQTGTYAESRHFQDEQAIYQTLSSQYRAGDLEFFVTVLLPHQGLSETDLKARTDSVRLIKADHFPDAVGLEIDHNGTISSLVVKLDLEKDLARENVRPRYRYDLGKVRVGEFETDASFLFASMSGPKLRYCASTFLKVSYRNQTLVEAMPNTFPLQLDGSAPRIGYAKWRFWEDEVVIAK